MRFITGVNYWPRNHGVQMWAEFDREEIAGDMRTIARIGMDTVRVFIKWADFQPAPDIIDDTMVRRFDELLVMADEAGVRVIPTFFCGHMSGENWDVPWRGGRDPYSDPEMLRAQVRLVGHFAQRYRGDVRILCWDLANEQDIFARPRDRHSGWLWIRTLASELKLHDPEHPVTAGTHITSLTEDCGFRMDDLAESLDFLCMHAYPLYSDSCPERLDGVRNTYFVPFCAALTRTLGRGADVLFEEFGATSQMCAEDVIEGYYRATLHALLSEGVIGAMGWCYGDFTVGDRLPYDTTPFEVGFGLVDVDGQLKGAGRAMQEFCGTLKLLGGDVMRPADPGAAIIVPRHYYDNSDPAVTPERNFRALFNSYVLARRAGLNPRMVTLDDDLSRLRLAFMPCVPQRRGVNTVDWNRLARFVEGGGTLYMSYDGAALDGMGDLFGVEVRYPIIEGDGRSIEIRGVEARDGAFSGCSGKLYLTHATGRRLVVEPRDAQVLWEHMCSQEGLSGDNQCGGHVEREPAIVAASRGRGHAILCDFALELALSDDYGVYERMRPEEVYRAAAELSGWREPVWTDSPDVSATLMKKEGPGSDEIVLLVNYSCQPREVQIYTHGIYIETRETKMPANGAVVLGAKSARPSSSKTG
jgi:endo-1,4-beta-mannosidase